MHARVAVDMLLDAGETQHRNPVVLGVIGHETEAVRLEHRLAFEHLLVPVQHHADTLGRVRNTTCANLAGATFPRSLAVFGIFAMAFIVFSPFVASRFRTHLWAHYCAGGEKIQS